MRRPMGIFLSLLLHGAAIAVAASGLGINGSHRWKQGSTPRAITVYIAPAIPPQPPVTHKPRGAAAWSTPHKTAKEDSTDAPRRPTETKVDDGKTGGKSIGGPAPGSGWTRQARSSSDSLSTGDSSPAEQKDVASPFEGGGTTGRSTQDDPPKGIRGEEGRYRGDEAIIKAVPPYPLSSRKRGEEGTVVISLIVRQGLPQKGEIYRSSGYRGLDQAALTAALLWRFPEDLNDRVLVPFRFSLKD
ncbi:TonB family protein [Thermanaerovibrio velox DSM 12556]|uniref:TonB family protein n=1 Tax=Thermanaerovibrio velox DSM 12556 TaxID=926567 RepID=H0UNT4_9BACT|nr:energy transducer TonB [Thermanaerovibrio velox]EHM09420.1 TonB family protein [Thermanaerovibrio velox DSM 12556]